MLPRYSAANSVAFEANHRNSSGEMSSGFIAADSTRAGTETKQQAWCAELLGQFCQSIL